MPKRLGSKNRARERLSEVGRRKSAVSSQTSVIRGERGMPNIGVQRIVALLHRCSTESFIQKTPNTGRRTLSANPFS